MIIKTTPPQELISIYSNFFKKSYLESKDEKLSKEIAWQQVMDNFTFFENKWYKKEKKSLFEMYITKAVVDNKGRMAFSMSASNTNKDFFEERMSIDLYKAFIANLDGNEFVSLSHYPNLEIKSNIDIDIKSTALGSITEVYIDGNILKSKGYFENNKLGIAAYNSIRKDRRDNIPFEERIRVSIGFYDYAHKHNDYIWNRGNGICLKCANKIGNKIYINGKLDHAALTRVPALRDTNIEI